MTLENLNDIDSPDKQNKDHQIHLRLEAENQELKRIEEALKISEEQFLAIFQASPYPLTLLEITGLKEYLQNLRESGIIDIESLLKSNPVELFKCLDFVRILDINDAAVSLVGVNSKKSLTEDPSIIMPLGGAQFLMEMTIAIDQGKVTDQGLIFGKSLSGETTISHYKWTVPRSFQKNHGRILVSVVEITAQREAEEKMRIDTQRLQTIADIESGILAAESPQKIAEIALNRIVEIIPCMSAGVSIFDFEKSQIDFLATYNHFMKSKSPLRIISKDRLKTTFQNSEALIIDDIQAFPNNIPFFTTASSAGAKSIMAVPLIVHGELIGTLSFISENKQNFQEREIAYAKPIADSLAIAIQISRLLETEQKARRETETLSEVASILNGNIKDEGLLETILVQLKRVIPYNSASIAAMENGRLKSTAQHGPALDMTKILDHESLPANILRLINDKKPEIIPDTRLDPNWIVYPEGDYIRCWMGLPLIFKNELLGVLFLNKYEPDFYTEEDLKLATAFANQASIALENARLNRQTKNYVEEMEKRVAARTRDLSALYEITSLSSQQLDLKTIMNRALTITLETLACRIGVILVLNNETKKMEALSWQGDINPQLLTFFNAMPADNPFVERLLTQTEPIVFRNLENDPRSLTLPYAPSDIFSHIGAPIRVKGNILGILGISTDNPKSFSPEDIALVTSIADQIGAALEQDRLWQQAEQLVLLEERDRIARELHDSATQALFSLTLFATAARDKLHDGQLEKAAEYLDDISYTANEVHKELRLMLYELRSKVLKDEGLIGALQQRIETVEARIGVNGTIISEISGNIPPEIEDALFRIAIEALNNSLKHASANSVVIEIGTDTNGVWLKIDDDGHGFDSGREKMNGGFGLDNMRQRIADLDGDLQVNSSAEEGTLITAWVPLWKEEE